MRYLTLLVVLGLTIPTYASKPVNHLVAPPPGATLPVAMVKGVSPLHMAAGRLVTARFIQRVPVSKSSYLPNKVEVVGHVVSSSPTSISILFTQLRWKSQTVPVHLRLVCAAGPHNVFESSLPVGGTDRGTADPEDWTTRQVGGDQVYRSAGWGKVYNQYSEPVGYADLQGVYQNPSSSEEPPHAMGPFSTTATGLHGLQGFSLVSAGKAGDPIIFGMSEPHRGIASGTALLLEVVE